MCWTDTVWCFAVFIALDKVDKLFTWAFLSCNASLRLFWVGHSKIIILHIYANFYTQYILFTSVWSELLDNLLNAHI